MQSPQRLRAVWILVVLATACATNTGTGGSFGTAHGDTLARGWLVDSEPFGDSVLGQPFWLSRSGSHAALLRFVEDTDGDGRIEARFGMHGEILGDAPQIWLYDVETGIGEAVDDLLLADPLHHRIIVLQAGSYWLIDSESGIRVNVADWGQLSEPDDNRCHPPRQVALDATGTRLMLLRGDPPLVIVRELATGVETEIRSDSGEIWRAGFLEDPAWIVVREIEPESRRRHSLRYPQQTTTCACSYCRIFAASYGYYRWRGPQFRSTLLTPSGHKVGVSSDPIPIGSSAFVHERDPALYREDGSVFHLPDSCAVPYPTPSAPAVILHCAGRSMLFDPQTGEATPLSERITAFDEARVVLDDDGTSWLGITAESIERDGDALARIGRLRLADGHLELGPVVRDLWRGPNQSLVGAWRNTGYFLDPASGALRILPVRRISYVEESLVFREDARPIVLSLERVAYAEVTHGVRVSNSDGCVLEGTERLAQVDKGPWRRRCVQPAMR